MSDVKNTPAPKDPAKGFLGWVERTGNKLPDPVFLFFYLILILVVISVIVALTGGSATLSKEVLSGMPESQIKRFKIGPDGVIPAISLLSAENISRLWVEMPKTFTHFHPLGYVLVVMLGAGVAERSGLFASAMRSAVRGAPLYLLTPVVALVAMIGNHAADAAYVVLIPLAGVLFASAGRHPLAGIAAAFAGVSGGFSANIAPGQLDALLYGITQEAGEILNAVGVIALWAAMTFAPGTPLINEAACPPDVAATGVCSPIANWTPFLTSLVAGFMMLFLAAGWAYGKAAGTIKDHRDLVNMMTDAMKDMGYYLVLAFAAAHFVAMFQWSNLGLISAVHGANGIEASGLPLPILLGLIVIFSAMINLFVGSASAKWALLAPVMVPMLMLLGISPDGATAVYRVGDGATNIITPLMVYFPLILVFARRWQKDFGLGSLTAMMIPYSIWMLITGVILVVAWAFLGFDLGPGAPMTYTLPGQ